MKWMGMPLRWTVPSALVIFAIGATGAAHVFTRLEVHSEIDREAMADMQLRLTGWRATLQRFAAGNDWRTVQFQLSTLAAGGGVEFGAILDATNRVLISTSPGAVAPAAGVIRPGVAHWNQQVMTNLAAECLQSGAHVIQVSDGGHRVFGVAPFKLADQTGCVFLSADLAGQRELGRHRVRVQTVRYGLTVLGFTALLGAHFYSRVGRRVNRLVDASRRMAAGDLKARTGVARSDEIGEVAGALEGMAASMEADRTALQASDSMLRALLKSAVEGIVTMDPSGRIDRFNPAAEAIFGWSHAEVEGRSVDMLVPRPAADTAAGVAGNPLVARGDAAVSVGRQLQGVRRNGVVFPMEVSVSEVCLPDRTVYAAFIRDVSERRRMEEEQREQEQRYRSLVDVSPDGIFVNKDGRIVYINPEGLRLLGASSPEQVLGQSSLRFFDPDYHERIRRRIRSVLETRQTSPVLEERLLGLDGVMRVVEVTAAFFRDQGEPALQVILHDVTHRRELEAAIPAAAEAEKARIARDLHDGIGQQLGGTLYLARGLEQDLRRAASPLADRAAQINRLLDSMLAETRNLARGLHPLPDDPAGLMEALETLAHRTTEDCGIPCRFVCETAVPVANSTTATHLYRLAQEAVHNAVKHSGASEIEIRLELHEAGLVLSIGDDGAGLPAGRPGMGLGMQTMRHRASLIGGALDVGTGFQDPDRGLRVVCHVPRPSLKKTGPGS